LSWDKNSTIEVDNKLSDESFVGKILLVFVIEEIVEVNSEFSKKFLNKTVFKSRFKLAKERIFLNNQIEVSSERSFSKSLN
jgi:hypothetical protein